MQIHAKSVWKKQSLVSCTQLGLILIKGVFGERTMNNCVDAEQEAHASKKKREAERREGKRKEKM